MLRRVGDLAPGDGGVEGHGDRDADREPRVDERDGPAIRNPARRSDPAPSSAAVRRPPKR